MTKLEKLQKIAESQRRDKARIEGKIESLMEDLSNEGFDSVDAARKKISILNEKINKMENIFKKKMQEFEDTYADELSKVS